MTPSVDDSTFPKPTTRQLVSSKMKKKKLNLNDRKRKNVQFGEREKEVPIFQQTNVVDTSI